MKEQIKILVVEDEPPIARHIAWCCKKILKEKIDYIEIANTLQEAISFISKNKIQLCLLDLNLKGKNGFDLLKQFVSYSFETIIISAYTDQAVTAFEYGVIDFVPKPFSEERLLNALNRYLNKSGDQKERLKYIVSRENNMNVILLIENILFFKAVGSYVEVHSTNDKLYIIDKHLNTLERSLPERFVRIHRSCIVDVDYIGAFNHVGGGKYQVTLKNKMILPLNRYKYKYLQSYFNRL